MLDTTIITDGIHSWFNQATATQFFQGGILIGVLTGLWYYLKGLVPKCYRYCKRKILTEMSITNSDFGYLWLNDYLSENNWIKKSRNFKVSTIWNRGREVWESKLSPGSGLHYFFYKRRLVILSKSIKEDGEGVTTNGSNDENKREKLETIRLTLFSRNVNILNDLLQESIDRYKNNDNSPLIWLQQSNYWSSAYKLKRREMKSVYLPSTVKNNLINDINTFLSEEEWYRKSGIPYHRGYLLEGIAGSGKTSLIKAVASHFNLSIYNLNLANTSNSGLIDLIGRLPTRCILLIEDIDCANIKREDEEKILKIDLGTLLNSLDGIIETHKILIFATTNHVEKLDTALLRSGRFDVKINFTYATEECIREMATNILTGITYNMSHILAYFKDKPVPMCDVQEFLLNKRQQLMCKEIKS